MKNKGRGAARRAVFWGVPALLFVAHMLFGANHALAAQVLTLALALVLMGVLAAPVFWRRFRDLGRVLWPAAPFAVVLVLGVLSLTVLPANPVWSMVEGPGYGTINRSATLLELIKLCGIACVFLLGCVQGTRFIGAEASVRALMGVGGFYAFISALAFISGVQVADIPRLTGGFLSANSAATVFGVLTVLGVAVLLRDWRRTVRSSLTQRAARSAFAFACVLAFVLCLALTASRMGVVATVAAAVVLLGWEVAVTRVRWAALAAGGVGVLLLGGLFLSEGAQNFWRRFADLDRDLAIRGQIFGAHWEAFQMSPTFGWGLGAFVDVNSYIMTESNYSALWSVRAAHNVYLQWLEEAGWVGASAMFLTIGVILAVSVFRSSRTRYGAGLSRGLVASGVVVLVHGTTDYALQTPSIAAFWAFILGLQFAFGSADRRGS